MKHPEHKSAPNEYAGRSKKPKLSSASKKILNTELTSFIERLKTLKNEKIPENDEYLFYDPAIECFCPPAVRNIYSIKEEEIINSLLKKIYEGRYNIGLTSINEITMKTMPGSSIPINDFIIKFNNHIKLIKEERHYLNKYKGYIIKSLIKHKLVNSPNPIQRLFDFFTRKSSLPEF